MPPQSKPTQDSSPKPERKMLLALCVCPSDLGLGLEVLKLWADLEDGFNNSIEVAVCLRFDMKPECLPKEVMDQVRKKFRVHVHVSKRKAVGWPAGCNGLEQDAYEWFVFSNRNKLMDIEYMMIVEADTIPTRKGWANEIMNEAYDNQAIMLGALLLWPDCHCEHINANCAIHRDAWRKITRIFHSPSRRGWDAYMGPQAIIHGTASKLIWQDYRLGTAENPWKGDAFIFSSRSYQSPRSPLYQKALYPAFIHGVKTLQGIEAVRRKLLT